MKVITIEYNPITGAQMTTTNCFLPETSSNTQEEKARCASHEANNRKNTINARRINCMQHKHK